MEPSTKIEELVADPSSHFDSPDQVLTDSSLSVHLKQKILESWKAEASHMAESVGESMDGGEPARLREISEALIRLNAETVVNPKFS